MMISEDRFTGRITEGEEMVHERIGELIPIYQRAFAGEPWFEVSKCPSADQDMRCEGQFSALAIGDSCSTCNLEIVEHAYTSEELTEKFQLLADTRPMRWYTEENEQGNIALAAFVTLATASSIYKEKYNLSNVREWLDEHLGDRDVAWLDEVFADKGVRQYGNLKNFGKMIVSLANELGVDLVAYRTINERMIAAANRDLLEQTRVFEPKKDIPDHRYFVIIDLTKGEEL
jgi:hypothetical protein